MSLKTLIHYSVVFVLSAMASVLFFSKDSQKPKQVFFKLPGFVHIQANQQAFLTSLAASNSFRPTVEKLMSEADIEYLKLSSDVYTGGPRQNVLIAFFESAKSRDHHLIILKKNNFNDRLDDLKSDKFKIVATIQVKNINEKSINLAYGKIDFLDQQQFNIQVLKLAEIADIESLF